MTPPVLIVIAKAPVAGRSKTRLCPPCTPAQAARLARAALEDTLDAVAAVGGVRRVLALDGAPGDWLPAGFDVVPQVAGGLGARLAAAFSATETPALLVGMDTPQVTPDLLRAGLDRLAADDADAVVGPATDGGFWAIGFTRPAPGAFDGVPMSTNGTLRAQRARLGALGLRTADLPPLRDVDDIADARAVAAACPRSRFARALAGLRLNSGGQTPQQRGSDPVDEALNSRGQTPSTEGVRPRE